MKQRNPALDIIRCFALFCVVSVHFFRSIGLYSVPVQGLSMGVMLALRGFFMVCVPLFLLLSGYLQKDKTLTKDYYKKILPILGIYVLASLCCGGYKIFVLREMGFTDMIRGIFSFSTAGYGWYIEMYIGLFLLIPFLNMMYRGAETQKNRRILVLTFLCLTTLPSILNIWRFPGMSWWLRPGSSQSYDPLVPDYWIGLFPISFYFLGAYLRDYPLKLGIKKNLLLIALVFVVGGLFNFYRSRGYAFVGGEWTDYRSILVTVQSVLVFTFLVNRNYEGIKPKTAKLLSKLSSWTLGAYLCSDIFDGLFYPLLVERVPSLILKLPFYPLMVAAVLFCSLGLSAILNGLYKVITTPFSKKQS